MKLKRWLAHPVFTTLVAIACFATTLAATVVATAGQGPWWDSAAKMTP